VPQSNGGKGRDYNDPSMQQPVPASQDVNTLAGAAAILVAIAAASPVSTAFAEADAIAEIVVTNQRRDQPLVDHAGNVTRLPAGAIEDVRHQHIHELMTRAAGVWISRGSGQEHLTAIRSPVLTGSGSCGGFLFLEDGIPIRPAGFCNVNQLFEIDTEQARAIEVIRGPGNALYGASALHGTINALMPMPGEGVQSTVGIEAGANDFFRVNAVLAPGGRGDPVGAVLYADDGGFRDASGYRQAKAHMKAATTLFGGSLTGGLTLTDLDQETAGFITGEDAYRDPAVNRSNPNPEAFRDASSARLYGIWTRRRDDTLLDVRPYVRHTDMRFLQHFLPGQPLEANGHVSAGLMTAVTVESDRLLTVAGIDLEWSDVFLEETQDGPTTGPPFLVETRPEGKHYDYTVTAWNAAAYVQTELAVSSRLSVSAGLRAELTNYDYDNRMLDGNTRDDGTPCGFGGCLYTRPADRSDSFTNLAPKLAATWALDESSAAYVTLTRGFRPPQMTELYRLQNGQQVADLDSERLDALEIGARTVREGWSAGIAAYTMRKRDSVYRDADGFNVSGARTRHEGIEIEFDVLFMPGWMLSVDTSYALHRYDFDRVAARGEAFVAGRDVDTAPRLTGSAEISYDDGAGNAFALQWTSMGRYYLDAGNRFEYPGHDLVNLRAGFGIAEHLALVLRLNNLAGADYADRADYAFGEYRYFPGRGRELFVELRYQAGR